MLLSLPKARLTYYQTTNFRLFQAEKICRWQFQIWQKWKKAIQMGWKHSGKRRNCLWGAISPFPSVFKRHVSLEGHQKVSLCGNGLPEEYSLQTPHLSQTTNFRLFRIQRVCRRQFQIWCKRQKERKHFGKMRNCLLRAISLFPTVFSKDLYYRHVKPGLVWERLKLILNPSTETPEF